MFRSLFSHGTFWVPSAFKHSPVAANDIAALVFVKLNYEYVIQLKDLRGS